MDSNFHEALERHVRYPGLHTAEGSKSLQDEMFYSGNQAFRHLGPYDHIKGVASMTVGVDEPDYSLTHAIREVAHQIERNNFVLGIGINTALGNESALDKTRRVVRRAMGELAVPATVMGATYQSRNLRIGQSRKDSLTALLGATQRQAPNTLRRNIAAIILDGDLIRIAPGTFSEMGRRIERGTSLVTGNAIQARSIELRKLGFIRETFDLPNIDSVLLAYDLAITHNPAARQGAIFAVKLDDYLETGFNPSLAEREDLSLQQAIVDHVHTTLGRREDGVEQRLDYQFAATVSPRRFWSTALHQRSGPLSSWQTEAFGASQNLRDVRALTDTDLSDWSPGETRQQMSLLQGLIDSALRGITVQMLGDDPKAWRGRHFEPKDRAELRAYNIATNILSSLLGQGRLGACDYRQDAEESKFYTMQDRVQSSRLGPYDIRLTPRTGG